MITSMGKLADKPGDWANLISCSLMDVLPSRIRLIGAEPRGWGGRMGLWGFRQDENALYRLG